MTAEVQPRSLADNATDLLLVAAQTAVLIICALLLLARPSRMTWAFFLFGAASDTSSVTLNSIATFDVMLTMQIIGGFLTVPPVWLAFFALRFPNDAPTGWRIAAERALLFALPAVLLSNAYASIAYLLGWPGSTVVADTNASVGLGLLFFTIVTFIFTYVHAGRVDRPRIRWVMLGITVGMSANLTWIVGSNLPGVASAWPIWLLNASQAAEIFVALSVSYAVVRHRVFDVRFFIGRAVVYGAITAVVIATLTLVDFAASKILSGTGLATFGEAGIAVIVGLSLSGAHKRIERFVDTTLFRSRIRAQQRLRRVSRGLGHATDLAAIEHIVVHEPAEAFGLTSAAVFRRGVDGAFERGPSLGWEAASLLRIDPNDAIVLQLLGEDAPVSIRYSGIRAAALPAGHKRPSFAFPMRVRNQLEAMLFYGPHDSEEELDPEETESLERLLHDAAGAYDHVRAMLAAQKIEDLEVQVKELRALRIVS